MVFLCPFEMSHVWAREVYIADVAKVQIWCSWAEALLGEAAFESPVK